MSISISKTIADKHKYYELDPNQELIALGTSNIVGSFFQSYPTTGGFSRTAVNDQAGAKTGVASFVCALIVAIILNFFTSKTATLSISTLQAIVLASMRSRSCLTWHVSALVRRRTAWDGASVGPPGAGAKWLVPQQSTEIP